jgi:glycerol uptake facilitator-like aquaporin
MVLTFVQKHFTEKEIAMDTSLLRKCIVEFIGTFFLVYVVGCVSQQEHVLLGPLAIGASLMVMIFAGGHCHSSSSDAGRRSGNFRFGLHGFERVVVVRLYSRTSG